jgi:hypothetical protein
LRRERLADLNRDTLCALYNPRARCGPLGVRKHSEFAGHKYPETVDRSPDPIDIRHQRHPLPLKEVTDAFLEILPGGACVDSRELRAELVIEPDFLLLLESGLDRRHQNLVVIFLGHLPFPCHGHHVIRETFQSFDHRNLLDKIIRKQAEIRGPTLGQPRLAPNSRRNQSPAVFGRWMCPASHAVNIPIGRCDSRRTLGIDTLSYVR